MYSKQVLLKFANSKDLRHMKKVLIKVKGGQLEDGAASHPYPHTTESCLMKLTKLKLKKSEIAQNPNKHNIKMLQTL